MEKGTVDCVDEGETVEVVMAAVGLDQEGPFLELGVAGEERGLEGEEGGVGVVGWEGEGGFGGGGKDCCAGETGGCCGGHEEDEEVGHL